ncbi:MAG TPA: glycosyltransferase family 39 protein [Spongiibacteraceae bacterium]|jgi:hypothetical protein
MEIVSKVFLPAFHFFFKKKVFLYFALAIAAAAWLRWDHAHGRVYTYDEIITPTIMREMVKRDNFDTNWYHADWTGLWLGKELFDTPQYNFSSYITFSFLNSKLFGIPIAEKSRQSTIMQFLHYQSMVCSLVGIIFTGLAIYRYCGMTPALVSMLLLAVAPQLVQESHYARPEAFVFLLSSILMVAICFCRGKPNLLSLIVGIVVGVGFACKFSLVSLAGPYLCWIFMGYMRYSMTTGQMIRQLSIVCGAVAVSILFCAPYIFINYGDFFAGMRTLLRQYSKPFGNFSLVEYSYPGQLKFIINYYIDSLGAAWLLLFMLPLLMRPRSQEQLDGYLIFFIPTLVTVAIFSTSKIFFERNLSQLWPWYALCVAYGMAALQQNFKNVAKNRSVLSMVGVALLALAISKPAFFSYNMQQKLFIEDNYSGSSTFIENLKKRYDESNFVEINPIQYDDVLREGNIANGEHIKIIALHYYKDDYGWRIERILKNLGYIEIDGYRDIFSGAHISSLQSDFHLIQVKVYKKN